MNKKYGITGLILIVVLATVMISGCIGTDDNSTDDNSANDKFPNAVTFQGMTFYLPDGYEVFEKSTDSNVISEVYSDGTNAIGLFYYPSLSKREMLSNMKSNSNYMDIDESASYGGYSGYSADYSSSNGEVAKIFVFEKDGKSLSITLSDEFDFNEYIPKIIG